VQNGYDIDAQNVVAVNAGIEGLAVIDYESHPHVEKQTQDCQAAQQHQGDLVGHRFGFVLPIHEQKSIVELDFDPRQNYQYHNYKLDCLIVQLFREKKDRRNQSGYHKQHKNKFVLPQIRIYAFIVGV